MKKLIVSGDSFTDPRFRSTAYPDMDTSWPKWPELLGKKLNMQVINLGRGGSGNEYIHSTLQDAIMNTPKDEIGMVIAGWSQAQRRDYQISAGHNIEAENWHGKAENNDRYSWNEHRVNPDGDLVSWVRKSLRHYYGLQVLCERYDIPYLQFQMIDLYKDYIDGIMPTEHEIMFEGKDAYADRETYPGDKKADEEKIMRMIIDHQRHFDVSKFIGWPITRTLGGWPMNRGVMGWNVIEEEPYVIDEIDNHPNAAGQELITKYIYEYITEK